MENMENTKMAENTPNAQNLSDQFVCPSPKVLDFNEKRLHWASVVRESDNLQSDSNPIALI